MEQIDDSVTTATHDRLNRLLTHQPGGTTMFRGTVDEPATVTVAGVAATVNADNTWQASVPLSAGTNRVTITATDLRNNTSSVQYDVDVTGGAKTFSYDANGNMTSDGTRTFEWDAEDQLIAVNQGTHRSEFSYDGAFRRVRIMEKENGSIVSDQPFIWDGQEILERRTATGATGTTRPYRFALQDNGAARYVTRDHLSSIREVADDSAAIQTRYDYAPFGAVTKTGSGTDLLGYTGQAVHDASGLLLMQRREYDTELARWLSEDPIGLKSGPNLYAYVLNNAMRWIDPEGTMGRPPEGTVRRRSDYHPEPWRHDPKPQPNGNLWGRPMRQDWVCSFPAGLLNRNSCTKKCCVAHDACYDASKCNWSSWLTILWDSACSKCNRTAILCVAWADSNPHGCDDCTGK